MRRLTASAPISSPNQHDLGLGGRLHDARQDHRTGPAIAQDVEPQLRIGAGQDRPEQISGRPHDPPATTETGRRLPRQLRFAGPVRDLVHPRPEDFHDEVISDHTTRNREASQQVNDPQSLPAHEVARVRAELGSIAATGAHKGKGVKSEPRSICVLKSFAELSCRRMLAISIPHA